jgi:hypothetical protein
MQPIGDLPSKRDLVWGGSLFVNPNGDIEGSIFMDFEGTFTWFGCEGSFIEKGPNFKLRISPPLGDPTAYTFDKDFIFEFKEMPD